VTRENKIKILAKYVNMEICFNELRSAEKNNFATVIKFFNMIEY